MVFLHQQSFDDSLRVPDGEYPAPASSAVRGERSPAEEDERSPRILVVVIARDGRRRTGASGHDHSDERTRHGTIFNEYGREILMRFDGVNSPHTVVNSNSWNSVTYGNGLFVAVASSGTANRVMTSPNGSTWTTRNTTGLDYAWSSVTFAMETKQNEIKIQEKIVCIVN